MGKLLNEYRDWVLEQSIEDITIALDENNNVLLEGNGLAGIVGFYDIDQYEIVELRLERVPSGEPEFFLHFELKDMDRAKKLFCEMADVARGSKGGKVHHILLCCTCGMTTSFFATQLNEYSLEEGLDCDFSAKSIPEAVQSGTDYEVVLLAPQVGYQHKEVADALPGVPVVDVPAKIFATYDTHAAMRLVADTLTELRLSVAQGKLKAMRDYDKSKRVLALSYIHREDEPTLSYRVLDCGEVTHSGMIVRRPFNRQTLEDFVSTLRVSGLHTSDFDAIGVAVPYVVEGNSTVFVEEDGEERHDMGSQLEEVWGTKVYLDFNASAAAAGCYTTQNEYESLVFHAQTLGVPDGAQGYVVDGKLLSGKNGRSGHLKGLAQGFVLDMDLADASWRVTGTRQLVARYIANVATTIAPEVAYVWCDLLPDMDELREELLTILPETAIPDLVAISEYDEYVLAGEIALCLGRLASAEAV